MTHPLPKVRSPCPAQSALGVQARQGLSGGRPYLAQPILSGRTCHTGWRPCRDLHSQPWVARTRALALGQRLYLAQPVLGGLAWHRAEFMPHSTSPDLLGAVSNLHISESDGNALWGCNADRLTGDSQPNSKEDTGCPCQNGDNFRWYSSWLAECLCIRCMWGTTLRYCHIPFMGWLRATVPFCSMGWLHISSCQLSQWKSAVVGSGCLIDHATSFGNGNAVKANWGSVETGMEKGVFCPGTAVDWPLSCGAISWR